MSTFQVTLLQRWVNQEVRNVFYYDAAPTSLSAAQLQELADDIRAIWATSPHPAARDADWQLYGIQVRRVDAAGYPGIDVGFTSGQLVGTASGESLPTQIALLVHGVSYVQKPNRVRTYLAGHSEGQVSSGIFTTAVVDNDVDLIELMDTLTIDGQTWERVSAQWATDSNGDRITPGYVDATNVVDTYFGVTIPATQRRRRIGVGT